MGDWAEGISRLWPREHGAWSLLLTPFVAALVVTGRVNFYTFVVLAAALAVFLLREPLLVLARQHWIWREEKPESTVARRWVALLLVLLAGLGALLARPWGLPLTAAMGAGSTALTLGAVWMALRNRQRAVWFQTLSCGGLTLTALAAARTVNAGFPAWSWALWGLCWLQGIAGILVVHTRLDAIIARKTGRGEPGIGRAAWLATGLLGALALTLAARGSFLLAAAPVVAALAHGWEMRTMNLETKLKVVGLRAMALSMTYALRAAWALRQTADAPPPRVFAAKRRKGLLRQHTPGDTE